MDSNLRDKNGNLLHGAAKEAVLNKLAKEGKILYIPTDEGIMLASATDRIDKLERQLKYLPIATIFALVLGCGVGKFLKPDLFAVAVGGSAAGAALGVANKRQGWF